AQRRDEVSEAGHQEPPRLRGDGEARARRGLQGPDADLLGSGGAPEGDPEVHRPRLRPGVPPQRGPESDRMDRRLRARRPAEAHDVRTTITPTGVHGLPRADGGVRFGTQLWSQATSWADFRAAAVAAEAGGWDS